MSSWIGKNTRELPTPALIIDLEVLDKNITRMAGWARSSGIALRPHAKSHKCPEIARRQIAQGAIGICCASVHEAEVLVAADIPGVLLTTAAAPIMATRIAALAKSRPDFACVVDGQTQLTALVAAASDAGVIIPVLLDLDVGLGRTGVPQPNDAAKLAQEIDKSNNLSFEGVQAYMGHVQHINDRLDRANAIDTGMVKLSDMRAAMSKLDLAPGVVSGGGTGSHIIDGQNGGLGELQAGSYIFMDVQYLDVDIAGDGSPHFEPALFVETCIINDQHEGYGVTDAGLKSFATDGPKPEIFSGAPESSEYFFMGDEHGRVEWPSGGAGLHYGDRVRCIVPHCDPTVNLYDEYIVVQNDTIVDIWQIAARGHS